MDMDDTGYRSHLIDGNGVGRPIPFVGGSRTAKLSPILLTSFRRCTPFLSRNGLFVKPLMFGGRDEEG
jgi:hypothetical protein